MIYNIYEKFSKKELKNIYEKFSKKELKNIYEKITYILIASRGVRTLASHDSGS